MQMPKFAAYGTIFSDSYIPKLNYSDLFQTPDYDSSYDAWLSVANSWKAGRNTPALTTYSFATDFAAEWFPATPNPQNIYFFNSEPVFAMISNYDDNVVGSGGNDHIIAGDGNDYVHGSDGSDIIVGQGGNDRLFGGSGGDKILGGTGNDQIYGGSGDDTLDAGTGIDCIFGGTGNDTLSFDEYYKSGVTASLMTGRATSANGEINQNFSGIENLQGTIKGDTLTGNNSANRIDSNGGWYDVVNALGGDDTLDLHNAAGFRAHGDQGVDTLLLTGNQDDWTFAPTGVIYRAETGFYEMSYNVVNAAGEIRGFISGIENVTFDDGTTLLLA
jgi:RTX calcium-binding nonapeptide repeat (4 copies)